MTEQTVVTCRNPIAASDEAHLERARGLVLLAEVHGALLVSWGADGVSFAWDQDASDGVMGFLSSLREGEERGARWSTGVAQGELMKLGDTGRRGDLAWGLPLLLSAELSRQAGASEVLADTSIDLLTHGILATQGDHLPVEAFPGAVAVRLAPVAEFRPSYVDHPTASSTTPASDQAHTLPVPPPVTADAPPPEAPAASAHFESAATHGRGALYDRVARLAHDAGADSGGTIAILRRLRDEGAGSSPSARCQASLALAIALATTGRHEEALLDGLDALARAKEANDDRAVTASLAFLSKLFTAAGRYDEGAKMRPVRQ